MDLPGGRVSFAAALLAGAALLGPAGPAPPARAEGPVDGVVEDGTCRCEAGNACWHYLHSPVDPPADECWCGACTRLSHHGGTQALPGCSPLCWGGNDMDCFLERHAYSWGIACSERWAKRYCCNLPGWRNCPRCEKTDEKPWLEEEHQDVFRRQKVEAELFAERVVICRTAHFYVVTDIPSLKIATAGGSFRIASTHELAHIYLERCEKAYREFVRAFGDEVTLSKPAGVYLPKRESQAAKIQARYFSSPKTNLLYGGGNDTKVADGYCFNGFCASLAKYGDDDGLHHAVRHMLGHLLISCWTKVDGKNRVLPRWVFEGVAHWLGKSHPRLKDEVVWCADEGTPLSGSGKNWDQEARKVAADARSVPIERLLGTSTIGQLDYDMHVRSWSYFDLALAEDRERFVAVIRALRQEVPARQAWMENMGCTPEEWDHRWRDRLLGRRSTLGPVTTRDKEDDEGPGGAERRALRIEADMQNLAARIRAVGTCADPKLAATLVTLFSRDSDAVREQLTVVLAKTTDPACLAAIREKGLQDGNDMVRAYASRVLGLAKDRESAPALRGLLSDAYWFCRAEAALALMRLEDAVSVDALKPLLADPSPKTRIAAMDALGAFGKKSEKVLSGVAANLDSPHWQVRSAAAESLGNIGSSAGVDPLINRMTLEAGRIRKDCGAALKLIVHDDLGLNPENWSKWWAKERERFGGALPPPDAGPPPDSAEEGRYAPTRPPNYGLRVFSDRVGYVLDMSNSMFNLFEPDPVAVKRLRREYKGTNKFEISREEIVQSVASLDPRARFNVLVFSDRTRALSNQLLAAGSDAQGKAESFLRSCRSSPDTAARKGSNAQLTNFYAAFRTVLDMPDRGGLSPGFQETPDTMFFLTDGEPTIGEIVDADALLAWFDGLNRYARIRVHVVAYGQMGIDLQFLQHLAEDNGGEFIHVLEKQGSETGGDVPK